MGKETISTLSMIRCKSLVIITVDLGQRNPNEYEVWHTFVLTIFLLLDIVKRRLLVRVTRVYIQGQTMS